MRRDCYRQIWKKSLPAFKTRKTISSRAEFDGAHTSTRTRYLRWELTTSCFCNKTLNLEDMILQGPTGTSFRNRLTNSFPVVGKKPSSPLTGIMVSLGLLPVSQGDARAQWLYLQYMPQYINLVSRHCQRNINIHTRDCIPAAVQDEKVKLKKEEELG